MLWFLLTSIAGYAVEPQFAVVVVVHSTVAVERLSRDELRAIFAMRRRFWLDGSPIRVFVLPDQHPLHQTFCRKILGVYSHQLRRIWDHNVFSGTGSAPVEVDTVEMMRQRIREVPGAIGYLPPDRVDSSVKPTALD